MAQPLLLNKPDPVTAAFRPYLFSDVVPPATTRATTESQNLGIGPPPPALGALGRFTASLRLSYGPH
ncbi:hypothetical protein NDU88_007381 [Pleurodeles waltl]|uniref:Uncharacterized protein n=1 Tax=Pleurodeles waltl TaxID=8319 RepID=A0AAV7TZV0_PLEWA|nr:hypothetical protein NDU88_007381 [Pleurodeles waltl]